MTAPTDDDAQEETSYYSWEGDPCRVITDPDAPAGVRAEIYVPGRGFVEINPIDVMMSAKTISRERFEAIIAREPVNG